MSTSFDTAMEIEIAKRFVSRGPSIISQVLVTEWRAPSPIKEGALIHMGAYAAALFFFSRITKHDFRMDLYSTVVGTALAVISHSWYDAAIGGIRSDAKGRVEEYKSIFGEPPSFNFEKQFTETFVNLVRIPGKLNMEKGDLQDASMTQYQEYRDLIFQTLQQGFKNKDLAEKLDRAFISNLYKIGAEPRRPNSARQIFAALIETYTSMM